MLPPNRIRRSHLLSRQAWVQRVDHSLLRQRAPRLDHPGRLSGSRQVIDLLAEVLSGQPTVIPAFCGGLERFDSDICRDAYRRGVRSNEGPQVYPIKLIVIEQDALLKRRQQCAWDLRLDVQFVDRNVSTFSDTP